MTKNVDNETSHRSSGLFVIFFVIFFAGLIGCTEGETGTGNHARQPRDLFENKIGESKTGNPSEAHQEDDDHWEEHHEEDEHWAEHHEDDDHWAEHQEDDDHWAEHHEDDDHWEEHHEDDEHCEEHYEDDDHCEEHHKDDDHSEPPQDVPQPEIADITPREAKAGSTVTITGSGFGDDPGAGMLFVGDVAMDSIISWNDAEIQVVIPEEALSGKVKATVNGKDSAEEVLLIVLWDEENPQNVAIPIGNHSSPIQSQLISDGSGGVIIVWRDDRNYPFEQSSIYAQHLNGRGDITWALSGVPLSSVSSASAYGGQIFPQLVPDGEGGAIAVWQDSRSVGGADIYAQRIDKDGYVLWSSDAAICLAADKQEKPKIISDGAGGAVIVWQDRRSGEYAVYAQRINGDGEPQWAVDGVAISTVPNNPRQLYPEIISDGSDGAIIVWQDYSIGEFFIYAQKIDGNGAAAWEENGISVSSVHASNQYVARPLPDGFGGAIIVWRGATYESDIDLWAQRINENGELQWGSEGARIPSTPYTRPLQIISDENGGAIIAWEDRRNSSSSRNDIYAQRLDSSGNMQWSADGVPICTAQYTQFAPQMTSDNMGGAIITWFDYRNYNIVVDNSIQGVDVYAQRINNQGEVLWKADGTEISTAKLHQDNPKIASDGFGGAVIIWDDSRASSSADIRAQGISASGKQ